MIEEGQTLPAVTFKTMTPDGIQDLTTDQLFKGKTVVVFGLPGAFTPTCSAKHLPGFIEKAAEIKAKGVDAIACISVNDAFVMGAWGDANEAGGKILMLADGSCNFTKRAGLEWDATERGLGVRSKRYAMIVKDGVVKKLLVDQPGQFELSSAERILASL